MLKIKDGVLFGLYAERANKVCIFFIMIYGLGMIRRGTEICQGENWHRAILLIKNTVE